ncbi:MAG: cation/multidrug efflux pump [Gammaproteobacteria bacterium]|nr:cation/multidrug efflux pump [Gammaproteobacteria bacterium]
MDGLLVLSGVLALLFLTLGWRFIYQIKHRRLVSGILWSTQAGLFFLGFILVLLVYSNLYSYQRLTHESVIADIYVRQLQTQKYQLSFSYSNADEDQHYYVLQGDQWQLDARILKWKGWANLLGLDSFYQLERLSGRYQDFAQASTSLASMHDLSQSPRGLDIWKLKQVLRDRLSFVDALFGQSVYMPMRDGAHYQVSVGQSGLVVRPINQVARTANFD